jgi:hypothetical protein
MRKFSIVCSILLTAAIVVNGQEKNPKTTKDSVQTTFPAKKAVEPGKPVNEPKPYKEVITDKALTTRGMIKVHKIDQKYFFEIADTLLGRDILIVSRISKSGPGLIAKAIYAGDQINENVIRFEKGPNHRLYIKRMSYGERSSDSTGMYRSVLNSNLQPILSSFDIKAYAKDSISGIKGTVIDMTDYLNGDNDVFYFDPSNKKSLGLGAVMADRSYVESVKPFPLNVEIKALKTYTWTSTPSAVTVELNCSIMLLPDVPMKPRFADPRVGYFAVNYTDFDANPQGIKREAMITRWRLEPKAADLEKYKRGELVEPKKQIVLYIDPATPKKWVPYLIAGVNDWQVAFEKAGFKNAIIAKEAPKDSTWSIDDARHSAIVYKPSVVANASGPHVHDPRSGEILETHINWFHNVMSVLSKWYFIQASAVDPRARKMTIDDKLMGDLIRFVSSHEVGHTLGLQHNFGSSSTVPVEKLRDKKWVEANGHTPSIMDYARFNYVAQPEDNIGKAGLYPRIGDYDKWAIEWGYKWMPQYPKAMDERGTLSKMISKRVSENPRLWFGNPSDTNDPRNQSEDLGDDAMLASEYGIRNLKRILPNLVEWTKEDNEGYDNAATMYREVTGQYRRYLYHVAKNIGGVYTNLKTVDQAGLIYTNVPVEIQKNAVSFLNRQLFDTPKWLIEGSISGKVASDPAKLIVGFQKEILGAVMGVMTLNKLLNATISNTPTYTIEEFFSDMKKGVWSELYNGKEIDLYRRNLQKAYINNFKTMLAPAVEVPVTLSQLQNTGATDANLNDISTLGRMHLNELKADIEGAITKRAGLQKSHLADIVGTINLILEQKK